MTALTLPVPDIEQARLSVAKGWAVVDPGYDLKCDRCGASASLPLDMRCDDHQPKRQPDPKWVTAAEPCETCSARGWRTTCHRGWHPDEPPGREHCPDCHGLGKALVEVTAGKHQRPPSISLDLSGESECDDCIRHVAWVTVSEVLAVVGWPLGLSHPGDHSERHVIVVQSPDESWAAYLMHGDARTVTDITADVAHLGTPESLVGRTLLRLEEVQ